MLRYRLRTTTLAVDRKNTRPEIVTIPAGAVLKVANDLVDADGFVEVQWDGESVQIFAVDLRDRGELIQARCA
jgi:hypothetical protein